MNNVNLEPMKDNFSEEEHKQKMLEWLDRVRQICRVCGMRFSVIPAVWFWRNRMRAIAMMTRMATTMNEEMGAYGEPVGPTIARWRAVSPMQKKLIRVIINLLTTERTPITISMIEAENARYGNGASADTVRETVNHAIQLKLLTKRGRGPKTSYRATRLLIDEIALRCYTRMRSDPYFLSMAKFAVALETLHAENEQTSIDERQGAVAPSDHPSYLERLYWGDQGHRSEG
tara:strand:- start:1143 stop:1835 length:693 start_codon:yes stop_codon:yes gene_type:complete